MRASTLAATAAGVAAAAVIGGLASGPAVRSPWYARLRTPSYQPPRQAFPVVWPALYADTALVSASTIDELGPDARAYQIALAGNLVLNGSWSWIFFNRHRLGAAALVAGALTASSADLTRRAVAVRGVKAWPLGVYPLWCAFATVLSTHIWLLNRQQGISSL
ncbi:TspO/MBR family protein [Mycobacterium kyorinense]|uniref:TspO protein n=1 Tax=Mycobacterium kyorinense TaxID=487514 RepID=A0A1X1XGJ6_9MYCO|nr:TspO/MBR family protein [Mycobacterium kyorinense]ORV97873.1 TspO protein [Mycobacterium kyorinense]